LSLLSQLVLAKQGLFTRNFRAFYITSIGKLIGNPCIISVKNYLKGIKFRGYKISKLNTREIFFFVDFVTLFVKNREIKYPQKISKSKNHEIKYPRIVKFLELRNEIPAKFYTFKV